MQLMNEPKNMDRTSKIIFKKMLIDFICLVSVGLTVLMLYLFGKPYERGFFCNDESLNHPFHKSTVTSPMLYVTGIFLPICTILIFEYNHAKNLPDMTPLILFGHTIPPWMYNAYSKIGVFGFGAGINVLTTDIAKYTVGRLRPHFMTLCKPSIDCSQPENQHRYFENFTCTATGVSDKLLKELRLSFPSGHSSFSAYTMIYLALYLQLRLTWKGSKLLRHFLQFICIMMAWFTAMSRISNYKHHWSDVLAGSSIGTVVALITIFGIADLFKEQRTSSGCLYKLKHKQQNQLEEKTTEYEGAAAPSHHMQFECTTLRRQSPNYGSVLSAELGKT